jgi:FkbH-like protein
MKLLEALELVRRPAGKDAREESVFLACGFTPLHLSTFLKAEMRRLQPETRVVVETGLFGDLIGNLTRGERSAAGSAVVVIEWGDLDPRLGIRTLGGWKPGYVPDIIDSAIQATTRLEQALKTLARDVPTILCLPTLPLPPVFWTRLDQANALELRLRHAVVSIAASLASVAGLRIVSGQALDEVSHMGERYDVKSDITTGFPYSLSHAAALGALLARLVHDRQPKKGIITDLDDTLWAGIVGEDGVDGISWSLDHGQVHGIYQQFLASLAGAGILVGVASKNERAVVKRAFDRSDLLVSANDIFPFEVHWSNKSESVRRILDAWNLGPESIVFIDDSAIEVEEVKASFPQMECIVFPNNDYVGAWRLIKHLRDTFGKSQLTEEDAIRLDSVRSSGALRCAVESGGLSSDDFLRASEARIVFETLSADDTRSFELLNKTNQFNLNGRRFTEGEWRNTFRDRATMVFGVAYEDKYGPLGKIAVLMGRAHGHRFLVDAWVMSCRAFSRRIEHQCLKYLFDSLEVDEIELTYESTPRNKPFQEFLTELLGTSPVSAVFLSRKQFDLRVPALFHRVQSAMHV